MWTYSWNWSWSRFDTTVLSTIVKVFSMDYFGALLISKYTCSWFSFQSWIRFCSKDSRPFKLSDISHAVRFMSLNDVQLLLITEKIISSSYKKYTNRIYGALRATWELMNYFPFPAFLVVDYPFDCLSIFWAFFDWVSCIIKRYDIYRCWIVALSNNFNISLVSYHVIRLRIRSYFSLCLNLSDGVWCEWLRASIWTDGCFNQRRKMDLTERPLECFVYCSINNGNLILYTEMSQ
jgi:hypothetical protein